MKVLILGADGMIGHKMAQKFYKPGFELYLNTRSKKDFLKEIFPKAITIQNNFLVSDILKILNKISPDYILNCCGITIRRGINLNRSNSIKINSELPYLISDWTRNKSSKLIQFSTDCVFTGKKGFYNDYSTPDAKDLYGLTKNRGEVKNNYTSTIRTSFIGPETNSKKSLLNWFISQKKSINGFNNAFFSGLTSLEISKIIYEYFIKKKLFYNKIVNVGGRRVSKYTLLKIISKVFKKKISIKRFSNFKIDRSLNCQKFKKITKYKNKSWLKMLRELIIFMKANKYKY